MANHGLTIGQAAEAAGLSVRTIRYYESIGLIPKPPRHDQGARTGGNRMYGDTDIGRMKFIHHARTLDLSLDDIRELLTMGKDSHCVGDKPEYQEILQNHLHDIDRRIAHLLGLRERIERLVSQERQTNSSCSWNTCECLTAEAATK